MNLIEALDAKGVEWRKSGKPNNIWLCCPFCLQRGYTQDTRFRLGVDVSTGQGHCFNCEWKPPGQRLALIAIQKRLALGGFVQRETVTTKKLRPIRLPEDFEIIDPKDSDFWMKKAYRYVRSRGVTDAQIKRFKLGLSLSGEYAYRVVAPIYYEGKLVGLVSRALKNTQVPKYKNSVGDKAIYGIMSDVAQCILVEGFFDALACDRACGSNYDSFGLLGHSLTGRQLDMLSDYTKFILWPDPDKVGVEGFCVIGAQLKSLGEVRMVVPYMDRDDYDPSEQSDKSIRQRVHGATLWSQELEHKLKLWLAYKED